MRMTIYLSSNVKKNHDLDEAKSDISEQVNNG